LSAAVSIFAATRAAQHGLDGPVVFGVGEEDFADAADFRPVVPAFEQGQMALAKGCGWTWAGFAERRQCGFHAGFQHPTWEPGGRGNALL